MIDSEISKQLDTSKKELVLKIQSRNKFIKNLYRTHSSTIEDDVLSQIEELSLISKPKINLDTIYNSLQFQPKNHNQEQFFYAIVKYASHSRMNVDYRHDCVFVTENPIYFEKYIPGGTKEQCLRNYFPNLILTNLDNTIEIIQYYEIKNNYYWLNNQEMEVRTDWYNMAVILLIPELSHMHSIIPCINSDISILLRGLIFRFKKFLYGVNMLGISHYFDSKKLEPIDMEIAVGGYNKLKQDNYAYRELRGFVDPDEQFIQFYHIEYIIPQVSGIFDNLAILVNKFYNLGFYGQKISFSNDNGADFLKALDAINHNLKSHVDAHRNFINLVYSLRENVIHKEGLEASIIPLVPNWNSFIKIDKQVQSFIQNCGNSKHIYKYISDWGLFHRNNEILLDPFFFSSNLLTNTITFTRKFVQLVK